MIGRSKPRRCLESTRTPMLPLPAAATDNCQGGILIERSWVPNSKSCQVPVHRQGRSGTVTIDLPLDYNLKNPEINFLKTRAWCFQESQLSRRLVTFDQVQLSYTCLKHGLVESLKQPVALARESRNTFLPKLKAALVKDNESRTRELILCWYHILADYTSRSLTFQQDKLVAIAGVAHIIGEAMREDYYAGFWFNNLPQALLWSPYEEETFPNPPHKATLPTVYRAPSWSWASVESPISNFICRQILRETICAHVLDINTTLHGVDRYGQVKAGYIKIRGQLREVVSGKASTKWPYQPMLFPFEKFQLVNEMQQEHQEETSIAQGIFDIEWPTTGSKLWILRVTGMYGLLLIPDDESTNAVFRRVGLFHLSPDTSVFDNTLTITII
jgi:hypothetical protein